jgi:outer membrane immunogenic protein
MPHCAIFRWGGSAVQTKAMLLATAGAAALIPTSQSVAAPPPAFSWTGFYIGVNAGGFSGDNYLFGFENDQLSFIGGGHIGYNWQQGMFVYGLEADGGWLTHTEDHFSLDNGFTKGTSLHWLTTVRARGGVAFGDWLVFLTGGVAFGEIRALERICCSPETQGYFSGTRTGWVFGGGIEHMLTPWLILGIDALFVDFGTGDISGSDNKSVRATVSGIVARGRASFRF